MSLLRRPSLLIYSAAVGAVLAGLVWLTWLAIGLESRERSARDQAALQEAMRLALWRMDSALSPIIAQEAARPYFQYRPFYPADRAYTRMWEEVQPGEVLVASPLLEGPGAHIILHFELSPDSQFTSPQAPTGEMRALAVAGVLNPEKVAAAENRLSELQRLLMRGRELAFDDDARASEAATPALDSRQIASLPEEQQARLKSEQEFGARWQYAESIRNTQQQEAPRPVQSAPGGAGEREDSVSPTRDEAPQKQADAQTLDQGFDESAEMKRAAAKEGKDDPATMLGAPVAITQGGLSPDWIAPGPGEGPMLLFRRRVSLGGAEFIQGFWMDWPEVRTWLLSLVADVLPGADIRPVYAGTGLTAERLAVIPAVIVPGPIAAPSAGLLTPTRGAVALTWAAVLASLVAVGIVLRKSIELAERRGQFVSAVTHELRTPLTTFCLYTQMLADGMVQTDAARADYLGTLKRESLRLARIVENVLDFARLGQRARPRAVAQTVEELLAALVPALSEQARRAGMDLVIDHGMASGTSTTADAATLERILTNLVENSTKYAAEATDRRLHITLSRRGPWLEVRYRDHGPGIPRAEESRVFQPFHRADRDAQGPTPGLGLGLALSRGLARELGGELRLVHEAGEGAEFLLLLPVV
jgi:signal transduction histidine kinase